MFTDPPPSSPHRPIYQSYLLQCAGSEWSTYYAIKYFCIQLFKSLYYSFFFQNLSPLCKIIKKIDILLMHMGDFDV